MLLAFSLILALCARLQAATIIETLAGGGSLEGYKPTDANLALGNGQGLAISAIGELYVSDSGHNQVLRISPTTNTIVIYAGDGTAAYFGDNGPAVSAGLNSPGALAFDSKGGLLIADDQNFVIRRVDPVSGIITTIAGTGLFTGQVVGNNPPAGLGDTLPATQATFGGLGSILVDSGGNVIVSDSGNDCVRKFSVGGTIATIAGTAQNGGFSGDAGAATSAKLNNPTGLALDSTGVLYIADSGNRRVRAVDGSGTINTVAGTGGGTFSGDGGAPTAAQIGSLGGLAIDSSKRLLITSVSGNRIRRADFAAQTIVTVAGNGGTTIGDLGPATGAALSGPRDIAVDSSGNIYIYDAGFGRIRRVDAASGFIDTVIGTGITGLNGDRGPRQFSVLAGPQGATFDTAGNLYIADTNDNSVRKVTAAGLVTTFAGTGSPNGLNDGNLATLASLSGPTDVLFSGGTILIADNGHDRIREVLMTSNGNITTFAQISGPTGLALDSTGALYCTTNNQIAKFNADGTFAIVVGSNPKNTVANPLGDGLPAANATLNNPTALTIAANGDMYIADTGHDTIRLIHNGVTSTFAGGGNPTFPSVGDGGAATAASLSNPQGVTIDPTGANLIVSDSGNNRLRSIVLATGIISTLVGNGTAGFNGDGDVLTGALVNNPSQIRVSNGVLLFADTGNNRVREIVNTVDLTATQLALSVKLDFAPDKVTGALPTGKDSVTLKASLPLPAGITAANLPISVDIVDLHQSVQLDATGKQPKAVKASKSSRGGKKSLTTNPAFLLTPPLGETAPVSKFTLPLKGTSVAGGKPVSFTFSSKGSFDEEFGRAGFSDVTTDKAGVSIMVRVNITLGTTVFSGVTTVLYKATQGKSGSATTSKK